MKKRKYIIIGALIVILAIAIGLFSMTRKKEISVRTATASKGDIRAYLSTTATIKSKNIKQYFGAQLKVSRVNIKIGDAVKKGDVLVQYDVTDLNNALSQAQINYNNSLLNKKSLENGNQDLKNKLDSINKNISDIDAAMNSLGTSLEDTVQKERLSLEKSNLETSKAALKPVSEEQLTQADNAISLAKIALDQAKTRLVPENISIMAEFDGIITNVNAVTGGVGNPSMAAVEEMDLNNLKAVINLGKYDAPKIKVGDTANIKAGSDVIKGTVSRIDPVAKKVNTATGQEDNLSADIDVQGASPNLKVDFDVDVDVLIGEVKDIIKVPAEAIKNNKSGKSYVYVIKDDKALEKDVELGIQSDTEAEIKSGLAYNDKVILNPMDTIENGTKVKVAER